MSPDNVDRDILQIVGISLETDAADRLRRLTEDCTVLSGTAGPSCKEHINYSMEYNYLNELATSFH
jgi:hypothetical protein